MVNVKIFLPVLQINTMEEHISYFFQTDEGYIKISGILFATNFGAKFFSECFTVYVKLKVRVYDLSLFILGTLSNNDC